MEVNGDLWAHFEKAMRAKGAHAIRISKVKGHTTEELIAEGKATRRDMINNDKADEVAKAAMQLHGLDYVTYLRHMHRRQGWYCKLVLAVAQHIVERYLIHRRLLEREQGTLAPTSAKAGSTHANLRLTARPLSLEIKCKS